MYRGAMRLDEAEHHPDPARRAAAAAEASILTPVLKAFGTELGFQGASDALQVWGGYGYVPEYGIEQTLRDARIAMIYEGTNEIQAIDLLQRKLLGSAGPAFEALLQDLQATVDASPAGQALQTQLQAASAALQAVRTQAAADPEAPLRVADDFLAGTGHLLLAWAWCATVQAVQPGDAWQAERAVVARHGLAWVLPQAAVHWGRVAAAAGLGAGVR